MFCNYAFFVMFRTFNDNPNMAESSSSSSSAEVAWERKLEFYKQPIVFVWESLTFAGNKQVYGISAWLVLNVICILMHLNAHNFFHFIGVFLILCGVAALLIQQLPGSLFSYTNWGAGQELLYQEICSLLRKREAELKWVKERFFNTRDKEPVKFYLALLAVLFVCQVTIASVPFTLLLHGFLMILMILPLVHTYHIRQIAYQVLEQVYHFAQNQIQKHQQSKQTSH